MFGIPEFWLKNQLVNWCEVWVLIVSVDIKEENRPPAIISLKYPIAGVDSIILTKGRNTEYNSHYSFLTLTLASEMLKIAWRDIKAFD